jgi:hypothetical protein
MPTKVRYLLDIVDIDIFTKLPNLLFSKLPVPKS